MDDATTTRDRLGLEILPYETCLELLAGEVVGRIGLVEAGEPVIVPVNYVLDGTSVVFRSLAGTKLDAAERHRAVAFEIDGHDATARTGWSVLVSGVAEPVDDAAEVDRLERLGLDAWALSHQAQTSWVRVRADAVTGRRIG